MFQQVFGQIKTAFANMTSIQRTNFILLTGIAVTFMVIVVVWSSKPEYSLLYSNLSQKDASAMKAKLDELKVENRIDGNSIYVNSKVVHEMRLKLAGEGLPQGQGVGYEIFGKSTFAMTDYMQQLNYKRALEGELSRSINTLKGINNSRVHLALPKKGLFEGSDNHPTASVILDIAANASLNKGQIKGIVNLVAASVEGLEARYVNVVNNQGSLLSGMEKEGDFSGMSSNQLETQQNVEAYLEKKAQSMLSAIVGYDKAIVRVNVDMNFDQVEKTEEKYDPEGTVARTETRQEEKDTEGAGDKGTGAEEKGSEKTQEKTTTNYEVSKTIARIVSPVGTIKKLRVAVVVSGTYKTIEAKEGAKTVKKTEYQSRTQQEKDMYKKLVMNAVGIDTARGDEIEVSDAAFDNSLLEEGPSAVSAQNNDFIMGLTKQAGVVVLFILAFVFLQSMLKKVSGPVPAAAPAPAKPAAGAGKPGSPQAKAYSAAAQAANPPAGGKITFTESDLQALVADDVEATVGVVEDWLKE